MKVSEMYVEIGAKIDKLESALNRMEGDIKNTGKRAESASRDSFGKIGGIIAGAFSVQAVMSFSKQIIAVRGEFEKFEAVLTNTLGSSSAAQLALSDIKDFAAQTPFSVQELTGSFVKLANQGFVPTIQQMRKLGDVAAATGKGFDQLAEAIIDAQVGEFERLKEFGIRAQKEGDNVKFTFKGVQTQVDFTAESIQDYILGLGEVEGVSGATAAISETLSGKVSNLGDAYDNLLNTIGDSGLWKNAIDGLSGLLSATTELVDYLKQDGVSAWQKFGDIIATATGNPAVLAKIAATNAALDAQKKATLEAQAAQEAGSMPKAKGGQSGSTIAPTKEEIERWHSLGAAANLTAQILEDAFGASAIDISGPIVEMDRLTDPEMEEALSRMSVELEDVTEKLKDYYGELERANMAGELFGSVLNSAFEAALINGESFFETFGNGLKQLIQQLAVAAATSLVLSSILSAFMPGVGFGKIFGQVSEGMGGSGGTLGGIFKLFGTDLIASGDRTTGQQGRF